MLSRALLALRVIAALSLSAAVVPVLSAAADADCAPTIDTSSLVLTPGKVRLPVNGSTYLNVAATFSSPCGPATPQAFEGGVLYGHPDNDEPFVFDATKLIQPTEEDGRFRFDGFPTLSAKKLTNADAGRWVSVFVIGRAGSNSDDDYDVVEGPSLVVKREAHLTATASTASVKAGKTVTITGKLTRANWNTRKSDVLAGQTVQVEFRRGQGTFDTVTTVKTSRKGRITVKVRPPVDGDYRLNYLGTATTSYDKSLRLPINVR